MTLQDLDKQDACKHLLEAPAPLVVGKLIAELRRYIEIYGVLPIESDNISDRTKLTPISPGVFLKEPQE